MLKIFSILGAVGFIIGLAASPVFADEARQQAQSGETESAQVAEAEAFGAALAGREAPAERTDDEVRNVSLSTTDCGSRPRCGADPARARQILGTLLATMGTLEARPSDGLGLSKGAR